MALVVDASVGLKWVLDEPDSHLAQALLNREANMLVPISGCTKQPMLWLQVRKGIFARTEAAEALSLLCAIVPVTSTIYMALHDVALDIGIATNHSTYDTFYLAFATAVVATDESLARPIQVHPDPAIAGIVLPLGN